MNAPVSSQWTFWAPRPNQKSVGLDHRLHRSESGERRRHHDLDPVVVLDLETVRELLDHLDRLEMGGVHLPVADDEVLRLEVTHGSPVPPLAQSTFTPGSSLPSSISSPAPPPVDTCDISVSRPRDRDGSHRVAASDGGERSRLGHGPGYRLGAGLERLPFEHTHRPVPEHGLRGADHRREELVRLPAHVEAHPARWISLT